MTTPAVTNTFVDTTAAVAAQVNQNFADLVAFLASQVVQVDGSNAMSGKLVLPAGAPTLDTHAANKAYVDSHGTLGYVETLTTQSGISTSTPITGLTKAVTVRAGSRVRLSAHLDIYTITGVDQMYRLSIIEGITRFIHCQRTFHVPGNVESLECSRVIQPTAGVHTYYVSLERTSGVNTANTFPQADYPGWLLIEDIGN